MTGNICFLELNETFSQEYITKFKEVFYFFKKNAIDKDSLIRKLHLGYTAMRPEAFDFVSAEFPWLEEFRLKHNLTKKLNFLETHGLDKTEFKIHIDGKLGDPEVMFNVPILNCTTETKTFWVRPLEEFTSELKCENGTNSDTKRGSTPHLPEDIKYEIISEHSFTNKCSLFRSDIFHGVINNSLRDEYRIMMHWWFPKEVTWNDSLDKFKYATGDYNGI